MKKVLPIVFTVLLTVGLSACADGTSDASGSNATAPGDRGAASSAVVTPAHEETETAAHPAAAAAQPDEPQTGTDTLVAYFSATGTTKGVAEKLANVTGADLYEIAAAQGYTPEDLDWHDSSSRTTYEQNDPTVRPEIDSAPVALDSYTTVYIGYPIWWGEEPRILDTFVESNNFDGITVIPFCTSGGSGIGRSGTNLAENAGSGNWLEGRRFSGSVSEEDLQTWTDSLQ